MDLLRGIRAVIAAVFVVVVLLVVPSAAGAAEPTCKAAEQALATGMLRQAETVLLRLESKGENCGGLRKTVTRNEKFAARLVAIGTAVAATDEANAREAFDAANAIDHGSADAAKAKAFEQPAPDTSCAAADKLLDVDHQVARAKAAYLELQEDGKPCAAAGLKKVKQRSDAVTALIALGKEIDDGGDREHAVNVLTAATNLDKGSKAAKDALAAADPTDAFDSAKEQGDAWLDQLEALGTWLGGALGWIAAILVALLLVAWLARLLKELSRQAGASTKRFPPGPFSIAVAILLGAVCAALAAHFWFDVGDTATAIAIAVPAIAGIVLVAIPGVVTFLHRTIFRLLVGMGEFGVADDAKADGSGLAAQMAAAIRDGTAPAGYAVDSAGAAGTQDAFDQVAAALSGIAPGRIAGALLTLMRALLPSRVVKVGGHVHAQEGAGCGLTLKIVEGRGQLVRDITLWQSEYGFSGAEPSEKALRRLAIAGAAWLRFALRDVYDLPFSAGTCSKKSWESEAAYQASLEADDDLDVRRALVDVALAHDPDNIPALFDAAVLDVREGASDRAVRRLTRVIARTTDKPALWCKAMYQHAALQMADDPAAAYATARDALRVVLDRVHHRRGKDLDQLRRLEGPLLVSTASIVLTIKGRVGPAPLNTGSFTPRWRTTLIEWLGDSDGPSAARLVAGVESGDVIVGERTHYNLACFASRRAALLTGTDRDGALTESMAELALALGSDDAGLKSWAQDDAGLAVVRAARPGTFATTTGVEAPRRLAGIRSVGATLAAQLAVEGIATPAALAATTDEKRGELVTNLRVTAALVQRWAALAAVRKLPLMTDEHLNQLDEAGVRSLEDLATANLDELRADLLRANGYTASLPTTSQLEIWMLEAAG